MEMILCNHPQKSSFFLASYPNLSCTKFNYVKVRAVALLPHVTDTPRLEIQQSILCGKVQQAIDQLEQYFPFVLANGPSPPPFARYKADYLPTTSIEPEILMLNLRILELIESCRTIPLPYPPSSPSEPGVEMHSPESYTAILNKAKKLYARAGMLSNRQDQQSFHIELQNVISLLAHKVPEHSSVSHYLAQARRDAVAAEVNSAILCERTLILE